MLLLTYLNGFQIWDVEEASNVNDVVSRRDGLVAFTTTIQGCVV